MFLDCKRPILIIIGIKHILETEPGAAYLNLPYHEKLLAYYTDQKWNSANKIKKPNKSSLFLIEPYY